MNVKELKAKLEAAILKVASKPAKVERKYRRHSKIGRHNKFQYLKMTSTAGISGIGGWATGSVLTGVALTNLLRSVSSMTYAYGYSQNARVDQEDFLCVLAIWMGKTPEDIFGTAYKVVKTTRAPAGAVRAAKPVIDKVADRIFEKALEKLLPYIAEHLAARLALAVAACAAPILSGGVLVAFVTNDYFNVKSAIQRYYTAKMALQI